MSSHDQDDPGRPDGPGDGAAPAEAVVWLRVDGDRRAPMAVEALGMQSDGGIPDPLGVPAGTTTAGYYVGDARVMGAMVPDVHADTEATRFKARGRVSLTVHEGAFYAIVAPEGTDALAFWLVERLDEVRARPAAGGGPGDAIELAGNGWAMVVTDVGQVERDEGSARVRPGRAAQLVAALGAGRRAVAAPGRPGAVPAEPISGQVAAVRGGPGAPARRDRDDRDDYVELPPESRFPRWVAALAVLVLVVGLAGFGARWWYQRQVDPPGGPGAAVSVVVPEGSSSSDVGDILADEGVVSSSFVFNFYAGRKDIGPIQAGTYAFRKNSDFDSAIEVLRAGPGSTPSATTTKVVIPEGFTIADIVARIHKAVPRITEADLRAALDGGKVPSSLKPDDVTSYEGLLFPATYQVGSDDDAVDVLTMMADEMETRVAALGIDGAQAHIKQRWGLDLTAYDMIKVGSMIQFEAAVPTDAAKIGTVTYNRLEDGMPLQYDSTSIYEAELQGKDPTKIDYTAETPYNTRVVQGLPPTPIAAPGEYALSGAMEPVDGDWLYFVLTEPKVVSFSVTYDQFLQDKAKCVANDLGCG